MRRLVVLVAFLAVVGIGCGLALGGAVLSSSGVGHSTTTTTLSIIQRQRIIEECSDGKRVKCANVPPLPPGVPVFPPLHPGVNANLLPCSGAAGCLVGPSPLTLLRALDVGNSTVVQLHQLSRQSAVSGSAG